MSDRVVLDASALLCLLNGEPGWETVAETLPMAVIEAVNLSEVVAKLAEFGGSEERIAEAVGLPHLPVEPFDAQQATIAGMLRIETKSLGLSLGDRACLALARQREATAVTTDRAWGDCRPISASPSGSSAEARLSVDGASQPHGIERRYRTGEPTPPLAQPPDTP